MKAVILILIIGIIGFFLYQQFFTPKSEEEKQVRQLEKSFGAAVDHFVRSHRFIAESGLATTDDVEEAVEKAKDVENSLTALKARLRNQAAIKKATELEARIKEFFKKNEIQ